MDSALYLADKIVVVLHDQINVLSKISISMKDVKNVQKIENNRNEDRIIRGR